jgi:hypothetical protein
MTTVGVVGNWRVRGVTIHVVESIKLFSKQCKNNVRSSQGHVIHHVTCRGAVELGQLEYSC